MMQGFALLFSREAQYRQWTSNRKSRTATETETNIDSEARQIFVTRMEERLPPAETLRDLEENTTKEVLDTLFERSPAFHSLLIPKIKQSTSLTSYSTLATLAKQSLQSLPPNSPIL